MDQLLSVRTQHRASATPWVPVTRDATTPGEPDVTVAKMRCHPLSQRNRYAVAHVCKSMGNSELVKGEVKTAKTIFRIVETIQAKERVNLTTLAESLGMPVSTVHNHVSTLVSLGYLIRDGDDYTLGLKFLNHGMAALQNHAIVGLANVEMQSLAEQTGELVWLVVEEHGQAVYVSKVASENVVGRDFSNVGKRSYLHDKASGKALLAHIPHERVLDIIDRFGLPQSTPNTITDPQRLFDELREIRETGIAYNDGEHIEGFRAVAGPIMSQEKVVGAISISGPANRIKNDRFRETLPELLLGTTNALELSLNHERNH